MLSWNKSYQNSHFNSLTILILNRINVKTLIFDNEFLMSLVNCWEIFFWGKVIQANMKNLKLYNNINQPYNFRFFFRDAACSMFGPLAKCVLDDNMDKMSSLTLINGTYDCLCPHPIHGRMCEFNETKMIWEQTESCFQNLSTACNFTHHLQPAFSQRNKLSSTMWHHRSQFWKFQSFRQVIIIIWKGFKLTGGGGAG